MSKTSHLSEWLYVAKFWWQKGWLQEWSLWTEPSSCPMSDLSQFQLLQWDLLLGRAEPWATLIVLCESRSKKGQISCERGVRKCGQGRPMEEQAIPLQTMSTTWGRSLCAAIGGACGAEADEAWRRHSPLILLLDQPWSCGMWRAAWYGAGGLGDLTSMGTCVGQCLRRRPCGTEPCWRGAWRAAASGKPTQDQFGKDPMWSRDGEWPWWSGRDKALWSFTPCRSEAWEWQNSMVVHSYLSVLNHYREARSKE